MLLLTVVLCGLAAPPLTGQSDTVPMIKLQPTTPAALPEIPDSLRYFFPWVDGRSPANLDTAARRPEPVYFVNDTLVSYLTARTLDPGMIDRISVLKGPAAEARHPGAGQSGVIMIYLKEKK